MLIDRAFIREVLRTALAVTVVIVSIFLVMRVMGFLNQAAEGLIPVAGVINLVGLKMIAYLDVMIPLMFYVALIMVLNRWYGDREMAVLASAGIGISHFLKPLVVLVLILGGIVAFFSFYLTPLSVAKGFALEMEYRQSTEVSGIVTGKFVEAKDGNGVYFVEDYNRGIGKYEGVFVHRGAHDREGVVTAQHAYRMEDELTQDQFLVLENGTRYEGVPGLPDYRVIDFEKYAVRIEPRSRRVTGVPIKGKTNAELRASDIPRFRSEWYWRLAKVFVLPVLALFALALCNVDSRKGKTGGMVLLFLVYLTYTNMLAYTVSLVQKGEVNTGAGIWIVHMLYFGLAVYCFIRRNQNKTLLPEFSLMWKRAPA